MIKGNEPLQIAGYLPIVCRGEDYDYVRPKEGETFLGYPWGYYADRSAPFIEVVKYGQVTRTVNALDLSEIEFSDEETEVNP